MKHELKIIASKIYKTIKITNPLPQDLGHVSLTVVLQELLQDI